MSPLPPGPVVFAEVPASLLELIDKPVRPTPAPMVDPRTAEQRISQRLDDAELGIGQSDNFARVVLGNAAREMSAVPEGARNDTLNRIAYDLYGLAKGGRLDGVAVTETLTAAAMSAGLGGKEIAATLASAERMAEPKTGAPLRKLETAPEPPLAPTGGVASPQPGQGGQEPRVRFAYRSAAELVEGGDEPLAWVLRGLLVDQTYGMIAGERKTLKSYVGTFLDLAVASGVSLFGKFTVDKPGPVVVYVGEGGEKPYGKRLGRIAQSMGISRSDLADLPFRATTNVAPIASAKFLDSMADDLDAGIRLLHLDPYYAYHGATANASNLFEEGQLLTMLSAPCIEHGANLLINNHYNKTGTGQGLSRITQAGAQEWCDSWVTLAHRGGEPANVELGEFHLALEIGSRQWGGISWDLDLSIGRLDPDTGEFDGSIAYDLRRANHARSTSGPAPGSVELAELLVTELPGHYTASELGAKLGVRAEAGREVVQQAIAAGRLRLESVPKPGADDPSKRWVRLIPGTSNGTTDFGAVRDVPGGTSGDIE